MKKIIKNIENIVPKDIPIDCCEVFGFDKIVFLDLAKLKIEFERLDFDKILFEIAKHKCEFPFLPLFCFILDFGLPFFMKR